MVAAAGPTGAVPTERKGGLLDFVFREERPYVIVFGALAIITVVELFLYSLPLGRATIITILMATAVSKASLVVGYYMHLRYEPRWLALIPLGGLALVLVLVTALLGTSHGPVTP